MQNAIALRDAAVNVKASRKSPRIVSSQRAACTRICISYLLIMMRCNNLSECKCARSCLSALSTTANSRRIFYNPFIGASFTSHVFQLSAAFKYAYIIKSHVRNAIKRVNLELNAKLFTLHLAIDWIGWMLCNMRPDKNLRNFNEMHTAASKQRKSSWKWICVSVGIIKYINICFIRF